MKKTILAAAVALGALAVAVPAHADPRRADYGYSQRGDHRAPPAYHNRITPRDFERLEARIDRGFRNGSLTRPEARRLSAQVADLKQRARHYWRTDGRMTYRERQDVEARYDRLSRAIFAQIRDDDRRYSEYRGPYRY